MKRWMGIFLFIVILFLTSCQPVLPGTETSDTSSLPPETTKTETTEPEPVEPPRVKTEATYSYRLISSSKQYHFYLITSTYSGEDHSFMIRVPIVEAYEYEPEEAAARMKPQIDTLNAMAASPANVNLWVYVATCLEDSPLMTDIIPAEDLSSNYLYFASQLNESIWCGHMDPFDIAERNDWYFATDHHWNSLGWYHAYLQLADALAAKYPDVTVREGSRVETPYCYYGSIGRDNGNLGVPADLFAYYDFDLPEHETTILRVNKKDQLDPAGKTLYASAVPFEENIPTYESGQARTKMAGGVDTFDHYVNFYPICQEVVYPGNRTGRNLLFLGDSFSLCAQELMASYFDHSYFFYVDGTKDTFTGQEFTQYCLDHQITDVIFLQQSTRILYDFYDYSGPAMASFYVAD